MKDVIIYDNAYRDKLILKHFLVQHLNWNFTTISHLTTGTTINKEFKQ